MERKHKWIRDFDLQFKDWSFWDNTKLVMSCIFLGLGWWVSDQSLDNAKILDSDKASNVLEGNLRCRKSLYEA